MCSLSLLFLMREKTFLLSSLYKVASALCSVNPCVCYCRLEVKTLVSFSILSLQSLIVRRSKGFSPGLPGPQLLLFTQSPLFISSYHRSKNKCFFPSLLSFVCSLATDWPTFFCIIIFCVGNRLLVFTPVLPFALLE